MPTWEQLYPGRFLKGVTLEVPKTIRIKAVAATDLEGDDGDKKAKCVIRYSAADGEGEWVVAKTNAALIAACLGENDYTKWPGHTVTIYFDPSVRFGAEQVGGIRVCGSPELKAPKRIEIKRPRRKKLEVFDLIPTDANGKAKSAKAPPPAPAPVAAPPEEFYEEPGASG